MSEKIIKFKKLSKKAILPKYQTAGSAGFDFHAAIDGISYHGEAPEEKGEIIVLRPGCQEIIGTGLAVEIPGGWQIEVRPRSGLSFKYGITVVNSPGTIDSDYLNSEIKIILYNLGTKPFIVENGDRIAQGVVMPAPQFKIEEIQDFSEEALKRNRNGGFGSTGK